MTNFFLVGGKNYIAFQIYGELNRSDEPPLILETICTEKVNIEKIHNLHKSHGLFGIPLTFHPEISFNHNYLTVQASGNVLAPSANPPPIAFSLILILNLVFAIQF